MDGTVQVYHILSRCCHHGQIVTHHPLRLPRIRVLLCPGTMVSTLGRKRFPSFVLKGAPPSESREQNLHRRTQHHLINASAPKGQDQELPWPSCSQSHPQLNLKWVVQSLPPPLAKEANEVVPFKSVSQTLLSFQHLPARNLPSVGRGKIYTQGTMNEQN